MKFVLWVHSRACWTPALVSRDAAELCALADDAKSRGTRVMILPKGEVPCDA